MIKCIRIFFFFFFHINIILSRRNAVGVVLLGLLLRFFIRTGHSVSHPNRILGGRCLANGRDQATKSLYEQHYVLHGHPVPAAPRFFILIYRIQQYTSKFQAREDISVSEQTTLTTEFIVRLFDSSLIIFVLRIVPYNFPYNSLFQTVIIDCINRLIIFPDNSNFQTTLEIVKQSMYFEFQFRRRHFYRNVETREYPLSFFFFLNDKKKVPP